MVLVSLPFIFVGVPTFFLRKKVNENFSCPRVKRYLCHVSTEVRHVVEEGK